jgi:hypothetical protein
MHPSRRKTIRCVVYRIDWMRSVAILETKCMLRVSIQTRQESWKWFIKSKHVVLLSQLFHLWWRRKNIEFFPKIQSKPIFPFMPWSSEWSLSMVYSSKILVTTYDTTWSHNPEDHTLDMTNNFQFNIQLKCDSTLWTMWETVMYGLTNRHTQTDRQRHTQTHAHSFPTWQLMMESEEVSKTSVLNCILIQFLAQEDYSTFIHHNNLKSYTVLHLLAWHDYYQQMWQF